MCRPPNPEVGSPVAQLGVLGSNPQGSDVVGGGLTRNTKRSGSGTSVPCRKPLSTVRLSGRPPPMNCKPSTYCASSFSPILRGGDGGFPFATVVISRAFTHSSP